MCVCVWLSVTALYPHMELRGKKRRTEREDREIAGIKGVEAQVDRDGWRERETKEDDVTSAERESDERRERQRCESTAARLTWMNWERGKDVSLNEKRESGEGRWRRGAGDRGERRMNENQGRKQKRTGRCGGGERGERGRKLGKRWVEQQGWREREKVTEREEEKDHCLCTRPVCRQPVSMVTGI